MNMTWSESDLQCAHVLTLYRARNRREQMWQVRWLQGVTAVCWMGEAQMKQTSASSFSLSDAPLVAALAAMERMLAVLKLLAYLLRC